MFNRHKGKPEMHIPTKAARSWVPVANMSILFPGSEEGFGIRNFKGVRLAIDTGSVANWSRPEKELQPKTCR